MLLEDKPCDDKNCQLYCLHLKKIYVTLCLHNMHSFNYKIWQWINPGALFFHRLVISIQVAFLLTLSVPVKSLAACPFHLERHWWWKKLSSILLSTLLKLAACGGMGKSLQYRKRAGSLLVILISNTMSENWAVFLQKVLTFLVFRSFWNKLTNKQKNLLGSICRKSDRFYTDFN